MRFTHLLQAVAAGIVHPIPFVGPILQSLQASAHEQRVQDALDRIIALLEGRKSLEAVGLTKEQFEQDLVRLADRKTPDIASALLLTSAEASGHLAPEDGIRPQRRFLYLAAKKYASTFRTSEIASQYGFLWRSYHKDKKDRIEAVGRVDQIQAGDLIVLCYRVMWRGKSHFRVLMPMAVADSGEETTAIKDKPGSCHDHEPFTLAGARLKAILEEEEYREDPVFKEQCGLNVRALRFDPSQEANRLMLDRIYPSPGKEAIFEVMHKRIPTELREWVQNL